MVNFWFLHFYLLLAPVFDVVFHGVSVASEMSEGAVGRLSTVNDLILVT